MLWSNELKIIGLVVLLLMTKTANAVRGCTVIAIQPDLRWKKAVCDSHTSLLTKLPADLPDTIINLRVTQQSIRRLNDGELRRLVYLEEFYLDSCQLEKVDLDAFEGLNRLRVLSLRNNSLQLHESGLLSATFYHLPALEVLDLSENPLGQIPSNFFPDSLGKSLVELRLSHVKGEFPLQVKASTFAVLQNIQILDLSFVRLETFSSEFRTVFQEMQKLRELQLGGNPWHCDCNLRWLREWYLSDTLPSMKLSYELKTKFGTPNTVTPTCESPYAFKRRLIFVPSGKGAIEAEEFLCKQWIDSEQKQITAILGSNISLICHGYFEVNRSVQWFKDHVPLSAPSSNYYISQSDSLDFIAYLNITRITNEDGGIWECALDDGDALQKAAINVTVKLDSGAAAASLMSESQRQNLVYAGIGVASVFVLLAAIALTAFCYWGKRRLDKPSTFSHYPARLQKKNIRCADLSDSRDLIANSRPDSPVSVYKKNTKEINSISVRSVENHRVSSVTPVIDKPVVSTSLTPLTTTNDPLPKFISLTTATTTTAVLTQLASSTSCNQPTSLDSTMLLATEFSSPSNSIINNNCADFYQLPLSEGYCTTSLPSHLFAQITGTTDNGTVLSAHNQLLVSAPCPIHGVNSRLQTSSKDLTVRTSSFDACPIHGSPVNVISRNAAQETAFSSTQTPRHDAKSTSSTSLRVIRNKADKSSYHTRQSACIRRESFGSHRSDSSAQVRYRTLPSRMNTNAIAFCPIHGHMMPSLPRRRSSSTTFNQRNQFFFRNREEQNIKLNVPYCSSCASTTSSDSMAVSGEDFEEYSSDLTESPVFKFTESESSDYGENLKPRYKRANWTMSLNRTGLISRRNYADDSTSSSLENVTGSMPGLVFPHDLTEHNCMSFTSGNRAQQQLTPIVTRAIFGEPLILTSIDSAPPSRSLSGYERSSNCSAPQKGVILDHFHSRHNENIPSSSSFNLMTPKSILIKSSLRRKHRRKSENFRD